MKTLVAFPVVLVMAGGASALAAGPSWIAEHITEVQVRDDRFALVRTIAERPEIEELAGCLRRATRVDEGRGSFKWSHKLHIAGERPENGSWLYDDAAGEFTRLSAAVGPIYRLADADRDRLNKVLKANAADQPPEAGPGQRAPASPSSSSGVPQG